MDGVTLYQGDCLEVMARLPADSVDLIATDPPYFKVKQEWWDRQWDNAAGFLSWLDLVLAEFYRVLKPNGSLYLFASPKMAARVEVAIGQRFSVLNHIIWYKPIAAYVPPYCGKDMMRSWTPLSERIIFAEHHGADGYAKGEAGYGAKCDELRGFVFEPLRAYLASERDRAGVANSQINAAWCEWKGVNSTSQTQKWFSSSCFNPPTREAYQWLRDTFSRLNHGGEYLTRDYEDLRRDYEDLRRDYEDLRRPFNVSADVPYTDVWTFSTVSHYPGKHPAEKPLPLMEHIISASSKPGAVVLDAFMGSGATGEAAVKLGRQFVGIDIMERWVNRSRARITAAAEAARQLELFNG